jgi:hypothetical protein
LKLFVTTQRNGETCSSPHEFLQTRMQRMEIIRIIGIVVMVLLSLYRYRHSVSKLVRTAVVMAIWQPIQEIIQAIRDP